MIEKLVFIVMVTWYSALGFQNSQGLWGNYAYKNPPIIKAEGVAPANLPEKLQIGSQEYWHWQEEVAIKQIRQMISAGIDGVFIDLIPRHRLYKEALYNEGNIHTHPTEFFKVLGVWLRAAKMVSPNFRVGIYLESIQKTAEEPSGKIPNIEEWVRIIKKILMVYGDHPNLIKINGKPCLVNFNTSTVRMEGAGILDWSGGYKEVIGKLRADGVSFYFVSDIRPRVEKIKTLNNWVNISDALHMFAPGAPLSFGTSYQQKISQLIKEEGGEYWWSIYPGYYRKKRDYSPPDFRRIHELWMGAIQSRTNVVQILTWNDLAERTDIWHSKLNGDVLLDLTGFYTKWFKTGEMPNLNKDKIYLACPVQINNKITAKTPEWPGYPGDATNYESCYYWSLVQKSDSVSVSIAGVGNVKLPKGLSYGVLGKVKKSGVLRAKVSDSNNTYDREMRNIQDGAGTEEELLYFYVDISPN